MQWTHPLHLGFRGGITFTSSQRQTLWQVWLRLVYICMSVGLSVVVVVAVLVAVVAAGAFDVAVDVAIAMGVALVVHVAVAAFDVAFVADPRGAIGTMGRLRWCRLLLLIALSSDDSLLAIYFVCRSPLVIKELRSQLTHCLLYTSPSPRDRQKSRMPSSA